MRSLGLLMLSSRKGGMGDEVAATLEEAATGAADFTESIAGIGGVTGEAESGLEDASSATTSFGQSLMDVASNAFSSFQSGLSGAMSSLGDLASEAGGNALSGVQSFLGELRRCWAGGLTDFVSNLGYGIYEFADHQAYTVTQVAGAFARASHFC